MCEICGRSITHLNDESYQKYFDIGNLDLQCIRVPFFEIDADTMLYRNSAIAKCHCHPLYLSNYNYDSGNFPILLLQLLYESQNIKLCQFFAKFITNSSLCLNKGELSSFDTLCLSYFINNSNVTWELLHLTEYSNLLTFISSGTQCKKLQVEVAIDGLIESFFQTSSYASNVQECRCTLQYCNFSPCVALLHLLKLPQVKILHVTMQPFPNSNSKLADENEYSELQKCIEVNPKLQELAIQYYCHSESNELKIATCVIRGVARNRVLTTLSLYVHDIFIDYSMPAGIIEQLLKDNITLKNLELIIPDKLLSAQDHLNEIEVNTPLTTLVIGFMSKLKIPHMIETLVILKPQLQPPYPLFHPFLQVLILQLESTENATELFAILQTNTTLKSLSVHMRMLAFGSSIMCESLQCMLTRNDTLCSFEVKKQLFCQTVPSSLIASLTDGLECNTTIKKLSIPIRLPLLEDGEALFNLISQKNNLTELQLDVIHDDDLLPISFFLGETSSTSSRSGSESGSSSSLLSLPSSSFSQHYDPTEVLFNEGLPNIIRMLHSLISIRLLRITLWPSPIQYDNSLLQNEIIQKFHETVFFHPSLECVEIYHVGHMISFDIEKDLFITKLKQEPSLRPFPIVHYNSSFRNPEYK